MFFWGMTSCMMFSTNSTQWEGGRERGGEGENSEGAGEGGAIYVGYDQDTVYTCFKLVKNKLNKKLRVIEEDI